MEHRFTLADLTEGFARRAHLPQREAESFAKLFFAQIEQGLLRENMVKIKGLGVFKLVEVDSRESIDINSGARIEIDGHTKVSFTPDAVLRDAVNKPFSDFETVVLNEATDLAQMEAEVLSEETLRGIEETPTDLTEESESQQTSSQTEKSAAVIATETQASAQTNQQPIEKQVEASDLTPQPPHSQAEEPSVSATVVNAGEGEAADRNEESQAVAENVGTPVEEVPEAAEGPVSASTPQMAVVGETPLVQKAAVVEEAELVQNAYQVKTQPHHHGWGHLLFGLLAAVVFLGIGFAAGFFLRPANLSGGLTDAEMLWLKERRAQEAQAALQAEKAEQAAKAAKAAKDVKAPAKTETEKTVADVKKDTTRHAAAGAVSVAAEKQQPSEVLAYPQLDGGEYLIVGIKGTEVMTPGKTLLNISLKYYKSKDFVPYICAMNGIKNPDVVPLNKELKIPELKHQ